MARRSFNTLADRETRWSAEDVRYSTVRWTAAHGMGYAIGPSQTDPRTGEILNADILISSAFVRGWQQTYGNLTPGADMTYTIARTAAQGRMAGYASALGIVGGSLVHTVAATVGLAALVQASPAAFLAIVLNLVLPEELSGESTEEVSGGMAGHGRGSLMREE